MKISLRTKLSDSWKILFSPYLPHVHIAIILLFGVVSYSNSLDVPRQFDDLRSSFDVTFDIFSIQEFMSRSRWLADITFALNHLLHGEQVLGYHLVNLLIHLFSACVLYSLVRQAIEALKQSCQPAWDDGCLFLQRFIPFSAAALFVCHPVQTQAVTYIIQRYTSLATLLYLSSMLSYLLARLKSGDRAKKNHVWLWGGASILFALLAMKAKEIAFTLPLMIAALEFALFRGQLLKNRLFLALGGALLLVVPLQMIYSHGSTNSENLLDQIQIATAETQGISRTDYLLTQFRVVVTYLRLLLLPISQNLDYDYPLFHSLFDPQVVAALLLHITLLVGAMALFIRSKRSLVSNSPAAGMSMRLASLGILWFYLALSVESSLIPIRDVIFEHRIYLSSGGFFMAAAAGVAGMAAYRRRYHTMLWCTVVLLCVVLGAGTFARNRVWSDEMVMWQDVLRKSPNKARARYNVGLFYSKKIMMKEALPHLVRALELDYGQEEFWLALNAALPLLGGYEGRCSSGYEYQINYVKIDTKYRIPWLANSHNNLGLAYEYLGNLYMARENYLKAVSFNSSLDLAWYNLALVAAHQKDPATVESSLKSLKSINPRLEMDAAKIIREYLRAGKTSKAG